MRKYLRVCGEVEISCFKEAKRSMPQPERLDARSCTERLEVRVSLAFESRSSFAHYWLWKPVVRLFHNKKTQLIHSTAVLNYEHVAYIIHLHL